MVRITDDSDDHTENSIPKNSKKENHYIIYLRLKRNTLHMKCHA